MNTNTNPKAAIINIGMGNLHSVEIACQAASVDPLITADRTALEACDLVILPGVGAFEDAMSELRRLDLVTFLQDLSASSKPLFGICLGMQLLMSTSNEFGFHEGLNLFSGRVEKFKPSSSSSTAAGKIPHTGWSKVEAPQTEPDRWDRSPLQGFPSAFYQYFVHSYYVIPEDESTMLASTEYAGTRFCSVLHRDRIFACQFHPERSGPHGIQIYKRIREML